jgi:trans-aconitate 2-methyltransferase
LKGFERVLDVGCGDGKITAEIAARVPNGEVVGVDPSVKMIRYAQSKWASNDVPNLRFEVADARRLPFHEEFDQVVSFNALHWVMAQEEALRSIRAALKPGGRAQLRLVPHGERKSLEHVIRETRQSEQWGAKFEGFHRPYLHLSAEEYSALSEKVGFRVESIQVADKTWDFHSRKAFFAFAEVTFVEWTHLLIEEDKAAFTNDVLDCYAEVAGEPNTFKFYQMDVRLGRDDK